MELYEGELQQLRKDREEEKQISSLIYEAIHNRRLRPCDIRDNLIRARGRLVLSHRREELEMAILCDDRLITKGNMGREYLQMVLGREFKI